MSSAPTFSSSMSSSSGTHSQLCAKQTWPCRQRAVRCFLQKWQRPGLFTWPFMAGYPVVCSAGKPLKSFSSWSARMWKASLQQPLSCPQPWKVTRCPFPHRRPVGALHFLHVSPSMQALQLSASRSARGAVQVTQRVCRCRAARCSASFLFFSAFFWSSHDGDTSSESSLLSEVSMPLLWSAMWARSAWRSLASRASSAARAMRSVVAAVRRCSSCRRARRLATCAASEAASSASLSAAASAACASTCTAMALAARAAASSGGEKAVAFVAFA